MQIDQRVYVYTFTREYVRLHICCLLRRVWADTCLGEYVLIHEYVLISESKMCA